MEKKSLFLTEIEDRLKGFFDDEEDGSAKTKDSGKDLLQELEIPKKEAPVPIAGETPRLKDAGRELFEKLDVPKQVPPADKVEKPIQAADKPKPEMPPVDIPKPEKPPADKVWGDFEKELDSIKAAAPVEKPGAGDILQDLGKKDSVIFSPIMDLKSVVLSIEWELNDQILQTLEDQTNRMIGTFANNKEAIGILRILRFLGKYIKTEGSATHPDAIKLILEGYDDLETIVLSRDIDETKKRLILGNNAKKYRDWVKLTGIDKGQDIPSIAMPQRAPGALLDVPGSGGVLPNVALVDALEELRQTIEVELQALRTELKLWRESR